MGESGFRGSSQYRPARRAGQVCPTGADGGNFAKRPRLGCEVIGTIDARAGQVNDFVRPGNKERGIDNE